MPAMSMTEYRQWLKGFKGRFREAAVRGIQSAAMRGVAAIQTEIIPAIVPQPVDRGLYRAGWRWTPEEDGATIFNNEPHAKFIEFGVRAANVKIGRKMIQALAEWVVRKKLARPGKEALRAAWAIAKTMQRRGIFGRGQNVLALLRGRMLDFLQEEVAREVAIEKAKK